MTGKIRENDLSALLVGKYDADASLIHEVFQKLGWRLFEAANRRLAIKYLAREPLQVVIAKTDVPNWNWRHVLNDLQGMANPPQLIVTSRTADESLWAEVLNIGGYDVMALPFERFEVERVTASAYRHFQSLLPVAISAKPIARQESAGIKRRSQSA